jgi:hypothetical protein
MSFRASRSAWNIDFAGAATMPAELTMSAGTLSSKCSVGIV